MKELLLIVHKCSCDNRTLFSRVTIPAAAQPRVDKHRYNYGMSAPPIGIINKIPTKSDIAINDE